MSEQLNFLDYPVHMWGEDHPATPGLKKQLRETYARISERVSKRKAVYVE